MIATTHLFDLIQSLTKSEKRSFTLMISSQGDVKVKNIGLLFNYIEKKSFYNEIELKNHFKNYTFIKQLTSTKYYLYHLILKSLKRIQESKTQEGIVLATLEHVTILNQKKLYKQSIILLKKIQKIALQNELYVLLFETYSLEEKTIYNLKNEDLTLNRLHELNHLKAETLNKIQNQSLYQNYRTRIFSIVKEERFNKPLKPFKEISTDFLTTIKKSPPNTFQSIYNKHYSLGLIYFYKNEFKKSYDEYKLLLLYLDKNRAIASDTYQLNYLNAAQNCIVSATYLPLYDNFIQGLVNQLEDIYKNNPEYFLLILRLKLALLIGASKYNEGIIAIEKNKKLSNYLLKAEHHIFVDVVFCSMQIYLWSKNYRKAIKWLIRILKLKQDVSPRYVYVISLLIELLIHIELNNIDLVISLSRSYVRFLKNEKTNYILEKRITETIIKHTKHSSLENKNKLYIELNNICNQPNLKNNLKDLTLYFNLVKWIKIH